MQEQLIKAKTLLLAKSVGFKSRTTQSVLQKWLREQHHIIVIVFQRFDSYTSNICDAQVVGYEFRVISTYGELLKEGFASRNEVYFKKYEQALEAGLCDSLVKLNTKEKL